MKSQADTAFKQKDYTMALKFYDLVNILQLIYDSSKRIFVLLTENQLHVIFR